MTLAKRLKALERGRRDKESRLIGRMVSELGDQGAGELDGVDLGSLTHDELEAFVYSRWAEAEAGKAPKSHEMPNRSDLEKMGAANLAKLYFADPKTMTPQAWQAFYTRLLEEK